MIFSILTHASGTHKVRPGQSLMTISHQYFGTHQCYGVILHANPQLTSVNQIRVGQRITIPPLKDCRHQSSKSFNRSRPAGKIIVLGNSKGRSIASVSARAVKRNNYSVQLAAFDNHSEAIMLKSRLLVLGIDPLIEKVEIDNKQWFRVKVDGFEFKNEADKFRKKELLNTLAPQSIIVKNKMTKGRSLASTNSDTEKLGKISDEKKKKLEKKSIERFYEKFGK